MNDVLTEPMVKELTRETEKIRNNLGKKKGTIFLKKTNKMKKGVQIALTIAACIDQLYPSSDRLVHWQHAL